MRYSLLALLLLPIFADAQVLYQVYGSVTDTFSGEKIVSCTIMEKDGPPLASTSTTGTFNAQLAAGEHILVFSAVGYEKKEIKVNLQGNTRLQVELFFFKTIGEAVITAEKAENIA